MLSLVLSAGRAFSCLHSRLCVCLKHPLTVFLLFLDQWSVGILEIWGIVFFFFYVFLLILNIYFNIYLRYFCLFLMLLLTLYYFTFDLRDLWIHISIVQRVFKNTSRALEAPQTWTPPRQPGAWRRRARSGLLGTGAQGGQAHQAGLLLPSASAPGSMPPGHLCDSQLYSGVAKTSRFYFKK